jgi:hypothetical protein
MKTTLAVIAASMVLVGCTEPDHAQSREPAQALQSFTPAQEGFLPGAPSYEVQEAIRSAAIEVRPDRALFLAGAMDAAQAEAEEALRPGELIAAHRAFPFNVLLRLTHRETGNRVQVRVIDGGPFADAQAPTFEPDPAIPISPDAARLLGIRPGDRAHVWVEVLEW